MLGKCILKEIDSTTYQQVYTIYGGSFSCHPRVLNLIADLANIDITYMGIYQNNQLKGGFAQHRQWILSSEEMLKQCDLLKYIDTGQSYLKLPIDPSVNIDLDVKASWLSQDNIQTISNAQLDTRFLVAIAKGIKHGSNKISSKQHYNRRREYKRILSLGGKFISSMTKSTAEFIDLYREIFQRRWNKLPHPPQLDLLSRTIISLRDLMAGDILTINNEPAALHITYKVDNPYTVDYNFVQMAVDPQYQDLSIGSALIYHNLQQAENLAYSQGKTLRFCFGKSSPYKRIWCQEYPVYKI
jgi:hypothetical protein